MLYALGPPCLSTIVRLNDMKSIRDELKDWTEIESVIDIFAYAYGLLEPGAYFPKAFYWASGSVTDLISNSIFALVREGILEQRDGPRDTELRWNPQYSLDWENGPGTPRKKP
jgi:hypothetical protein